MIIFLHELISKPRVSLLFKIFPFLVQLMSNANRDSDGDHIVADNYNRAPFNDRPMLALETYLSERDKLEV